MLLQRHNAALGALIEGRISLASRNEVVSFWRRCKKNLKFEYGDKLHNNSLPWGFSSTCTY